MKLLASNRKSYKDICFHHVLILMNNPSISCYSLFHNLPQNLIYLGEFAEEKL